MTLFQAFGQFAGQTVAIPDVEAFDFIASGTISAGVSLNFDNCFSADYDYYLIKQDLSSSANSADFLFRLRASGSTDSGTNYRVQNLSASDATLTASRNTGLTNWNSTIASQTGGDGLIPFAHLVVQDPFAARRTTGYMTGMIAVNNGGAMVFFQRTAAHDLTNSYDGFSIVDSTGNMTGTVQVYGWKV